VATALERVHFVDVARDALLMARIHSGDLQLEREAQALPEVVQGARVALDAVLATHPVTVDFPPDLPLVPMDAKLMRRVFESLLGNVAKHTPAGTPLRIAARVSGRMVEATVEDQGPGLPQGREEQVFESFQRGDSLSGSKGAGLGLAISRAIVEAHGGTISAERRDERGARFVVRLPLAGGVKLT
jgi:two-component system sensor histidine kinase KdpD